MRFLLSNDDGYFAPGLKALADAVAPLGEVTVVAPDRNRSGVSSALTLDTPIRYHLSADGYFAVTGTPADCVHLAIHRLMPEAPHIVIAGINAGPNLGDDTLYSGTVAAAIEGRHLGHPAIAVSLCSHEGKHYETAAAVVVGLLKNLHNHPLEANRILNINVPDRPLDQIKGLRVTRLGHRHRADTIIPARDPKGRPVFWIGPPAQGEDVGENTDFQAIEEGFVSVTPLQVDLTAYNALPTMRSWIEGISLG